MLQQRGEFLETRQAALTLQSLWRGVKARRYVDWLRNVEHAVRTAQRVWRGRQARAQLAEAEQLAQVRARLRLATATYAPERGLGARTHAAVATLLHASQLPVLIDACKTLGTSTRFSSVCCSIVSDSTAIPALFDVIRGCNRSQPHLKLLRAALSVLDNISRFPDISFRIAEHPDCVPCLVDLLQMYWNQPEIFLPVCHLFANLLADEYTLADVRQLEPQLKRLVGINTNLTKKMMAERRLSLPTQNRLAAKKAWGIASECHSALKSLLTLLQSEV